MLQILKRHNQSLIKFAFLGLFVILIAQMQSLFALSTTDVIGKVDEVSTDILSIIKANGVKIIAITIAWASVGLFALLNKPIVRPVFAALIVTGVVIFIHKWA